MTTVATPARFRTETDFIKSYPNDFSDREKRLAGAILRNKNITDTFECQPVVGAFNSADGLAIAAEPASGLLLGFQTRQAAYELYYAAIETGGTAVAKVPVVTAAGLNLPMDANQTDGPTAVEMTMGTTARSAGKFTVGTDADFFVEATIAIADISDVTELIFGFRKAEAYRADPDDYDEAAAFNVGAGADGRINTWTILNNAATTTTDTGATAWADAGTKTLRVEVRRDRKITFYVDGTAYSSSFQLDSGEVVVPFLHLDGETGDAEVYLSSWKCGRL